MSQSGGSEELVLASDFGVLDRVDELAVRYGRLAGFDDGPLMEIAIAVVEAVTNAIVHGNKCDESKTVRMRIEWEPGMFALTVHDEGEGFDLACVMDPTEPDRCMETSGRGIYIMRQVMDTVDYEMGEGSGTTLRLTKSLRPD